MHDLTLIVETVTPMFLGGADAAQPEADPELRAPPFRGALRYWLRALLAGSVRGLQELRERESAAFGGVEPHPGASAVSVRVSPRAVPPLEIAKRRPLPHSQSKRFQQYAFIEGGRFALTLAARPGQATVPAEAFTALWLLLMLGGVGRRSRRGFGSLRVISAQGGSGSAMGALTVQPQDGPALAAHIKSFLAPLAAAGPSAAATAAPPSHPTLDPRFCKVVACERPFAPPGGAGHPYAQVMVDFWDELRSSPFLDMPEFSPDVMYGRRASALIAHIARSDAGLHLVLTVFKSCLRDGQPGDWNKAQRFLDVFTGGWWQGQQVYGQASGMKGVW